MSKVNLVIGSISIMAACGSDLDTLKLEQPDPVAQRVEMACMQQELEPRVAAAVAVIRKACGEVGENTCFTIACLDQNGALIGHSTKLGVNEICKFEGEPEDAQYTVIKGNGSAVVPVIDDVKDVRERCTALGGEIELRAGAYSNLVEAGTAQKGACPDLCQ